MSASPPQPLLLPLFLFDVSKDEALTPSNGLRKFVHRLRASACARVRARARASMER